MKTEPNESAYPIVGEQLGVTKREYFASIAFQGLIAGVRYYNLRDINEDVLAEKAVKLANALGVALNRMPTK